MKGQEWSTDLTQPHMHLWCTFPLFAQCFYFPILDLIPRITPIKLLYLCSPYQLVRPYPTLCNKAFFINSTSSSFPWIFCSTDYTLCYCKQLILHILSYLFLLTFFIVNSYLHHTFCFLRVIYGRGGRIFFFPPFLLAFIWGGMENGNLIRLYPTTRFALYFWEYVMTVY